MCWWTACFRGFGGRGRSRWPGVLGGPSPVALPSEGALAARVPDPASCHHPYPHERPGRHAVLAWAERLVPEICAEGRNVTCLWLKIHVASAISRVGKLYFVTSITQKAQCSLIYWRFTPACKMLTLGGAYIDAYRQLKLRIHSFLPSVLKKNPLFIASLWRNNAPCNQGRCDFVGDDLGAL